MLDIAPQRASGKGLFCGGLVVHLKAGGSIVGNDSAGSLIPDSAYIARFEVPADLSWVLIVEKEVGAHERFAPEALTLVIGGVQDSLRTRPGRKVARAGTRHPHYGASV
jgi:hypothetical protein